MGVGFKAQYDLDLTPAERLKASGMRKAIRIGANRAAAKVKAAVVSHAEQVKLIGAYAKSVRIKVKVYKGDRYVSIVGASAKYKRTRGRYTRGKNKGQPRVIRPAKYAGMLEKGTKRSRPRPVLKPAFDASSAAYLDDVRREVGLEIQRELTRQSAE